MTITIRALQVISVIESGSLAVLLANLATVHHPLLSINVGLLHGIAYLGCIASATLVSVWPDPDRLIPGL